jgi:hypothetical protein
MGKGDRTMCSKNRVIGVILSFVSVLVTGIAFGAGGDYPLPTWPQKFSLGPGQTASFGFPMSQAGNIVVDIQWTGAPLMISLKEALASPSKPGIRQEIPSALGSQQQPPKTRVTFTLSAADVQKNLIWQVNITPPAQPLKAAPVSGPVKPVADGQIIITTPPVDMAKINPIIQSLAQQRRTALQSTPKALPAKAINRIQAFNQERAKRQAAAQQTLLTQMNKTKNADETALKQTAATMTAKRPSMPQMVWATAAMTTRRLSATSASSSITPTKTIPTRYSKPTILTANPGKGSPGDEIIIKAAGISDDPAGKQVLLTLQPMVTIPGKIVSTSLSGGEVVLAVAVPAPQGAPLDYNGQMYLQDEKGVASNAVSFHFIPIQVPVVNQVRNTGASRTSGESLAVDGANFMPGSHACFIFPWNPQTVVASTGQVNSPLQLISPIPGYSQPKRFMAKMFIRYPYKAKYLQGDVDSNPVDIFLDASAPTISGMSANSGQPGDSVLLSGEGFCDTKGEVHFVISPNQDVTAPIIQWSDTQILVQIPDASGIRDPYAGKCYIKKPNGVKSGGLTFTFVPAVERKFVNVKEDLPEWNVLFSKRTGGDSWRSESKHFQDGKYVAVDDSVPDVSIEVVHQSRFWYSNQGDDLFFWHSNEPIFFPPGTTAVSKLKNGWKVAAVDFEGFNVDTICSSWISESHVGTDDPSVKVHYSITYGIPIDWSFFYDLSIEIEGPKGVPYK